MKWVVDEDVMKEDNSKKEEEEAEKFWRGKTIKRKWRKKKEDEDHGRD